MISANEALTHVLEAARPLGAERVAIGDGLGRVLAETITAARDVPGYDNSAMDGFAFRHADLGVLPTRLALVGGVRAGDRVRGGPAVTDGQAIAISTGAPIPPGADTVVRVEDTDSDERTVEIRRDPGRGANVRGRAEDVGEGTEVLAAGRVLRPSDVGLLASVGRTRISVVRRVTVAIVSTGDEVVDADAVLEPGQIVNSNAHALAAAVAECGARPLVLPPTEDRPEAIRERFAEALGFDVVLSTGGVSVGRHDHVKAVLDDLGVDRRFWRVAQKPGRPLTFGARDGHLVFGLPGNPVSALVCFYAYARPALLRAMGHRDVHLPRRPVRAGETIRGSEGLLDFVRCRLEGTGDARVAWSTGSQSSAVLRSVTLADGLVLLPPERTEVHEGETVDALLLPGPHRGLEALNPFA